jgi:hypothetical protein
MDDLAVNLMAERPLFNVVELPYCQALMLEHWNADPGRFFVGYRTRRGFHGLLGHGVVDEFRTISGPVLLAPTSILGGIYDAGMQLADARDIAAEMDQGWPPMTVGIDVTAPLRADNWVAEFLSAIQQEKNIGEAPWKHTMRAAGGEFNLQIMQCSVGELPVATVIVTDAPMLPQQLERLADFDSAAITIAVSVGNRLPRVSANEFHQVDVISEQQLTSMLAAARRTSR